MRSAALDRHVDDPTTRSQRPPAAERRRPAPRASRRIGYLAAAVVNVALLWVVDHLLEWGWPPFLTEAFADLLPLVSASLAASAAVNLLWAWRDPAWFKHLAQIGLNLVSVAVIVRTWQIFPFDFTGSWSGWETLVRIGLGLGFVGVVVGTVVELVGLVSAITRRSRTAS